MGQVIPFAFWKAQQSATNGWAWVGGSKTNDQFSHGSLGVASTNAGPGARTDSVTWVDNSGNFWLFGGDGYDDGDPWFGNTGHNSDLWKYEPSTGKWTFVAGYPYVEQGGNYGTKGVPSTANFPGSRVGSVSWVDNSGNLWLFGGWGGDELGHGYGSLNDLWRFNPTTLEWTWMSGDKWYGQGGTCGTQGVAAAGNVPGGRANQGDNGMVDASGNLWLFGGVGLDCVGGFGNLSDLWKYDITTGQWTWMSGYQQADMPAAYGTKGTGSTSNNPGPRIEYVTWADKIGNLWVFGGEGTDASGTSGFLNDMWKYEISSGKWTWVAGSSSVSGVPTFGTKGTAAAANTPGAKKSAVGKTDAAGNLWLFSGLSFDTGGNSGASNDLWKFNPSTGQWAWISGSQSLETYDPMSGTYGTQGVGSTSNLPSTRVFPMMWVQPVTGKFFFFGGWGWMDKNSDNQGYLSDLWSFDPSNLQWTWVSGPKDSTSNIVPGTLGVGSTTNLPGARYGASTFQDASGNLYLFGGYGVSPQGGSGPFNDIWKYEPANGKWTMLFGDGYPSWQGVFGSKGVAGTAYSPGGRGLAAAWMDASGMIWIFGGYGNDSANNWGELNDMWKFNPTNSQWTWVTGSKTYLSKGTYGTKGTAAASNTPGARNSMSYWKDASGNLWLFGGAGYDSASTPNYGHLNDLWKFNGTQWTWVSGGKTIATSGPTYGTKGVAAGSNVPGGREESFGGVDSAGNIWIFGGGGVDANNVDDFLCDLWKFDGTNWTWVSGSKFSGVSGTYGTKGTGSTSNLPGCRWSVRGGIDSSGKIWLFGGWGWDSTGGNINVLNDLWKFDPSNGQWTWVTGSNLAEQFGTASSQGSFSASNTPGTRWYQMSWMDSSNNLWLYGGKGYDANNTKGWLYDLWKYKP
ncbi:MAG: hypothetical protein JSU04_15210 [Bdellovibrionales bacterium]|nr:hypothetical protein [Bdellovibrionales bacterium]